MLELAGGDYLISQPIVIPINYGNLHIQQGTIRASPSFPTSGFLITVGGSSCSNSQGSCNENFGINMVNATARLLRALWSQPMYLPQVMLDCQQVCMGGLSITATMGANVGPQMFFLGFNQHGIVIAGTTAIRKTMT